MATKQCFANCHMTPEEFGFWEVCRSLSYKFKGKLIFDGRTIAEYFDSTGKNTAYRLAKRLCTLGWFVCSKKSKRGKGGLWNSTEYQVLSHPEWVEKHGIRHCKHPVPETGLEQAEAGFIQSQKREQSSPRNGNSPVPETGHSTEDTSFLRKKPFEELRPATQEPLKKRILIEAEHEHGSAENVRPVPETGLVDSFAGILEYDHKVRRWYADRNIGRPTTPDEIAEMARRNAQHLTP